MMLFGFVLSYSVKRNLKGNSTLLFQDSYIRKRKIRPNRKDNRKDSK